jgi:hypothetical protein
MHLLVLPIYKMATSDQKSQLAATFTLNQQQLIGQIFDTKISELIESGGLVYSHCRNSCSRLPSPRAPEHSRFPVPTTPLQAFDKQLTILERQLSEQATKLQQFIDNNSCSEANVFNASTNSVAANPSTTANLVGKLTNVEECLTDFRISF